MTTDEMIEVLQVYNEGKEIEVYDEKGRLVDALAARGDEGRDTLR